MDLIVDRTGYYPVKVADYALQPGKNVLDARILLYSTRTPITLPGEFGFTLKPDATIHDVVPLYKHYSGVKVERAARASYDVHIPVQYGIQKTRNQVERICRALIASPHVEDARPLVYVKASVLNW